MLKFAYYLSRFGKAMVVVGASVLVGASVGGLGAYMPHSVSTESLIGVMLLMAVSLAIVFDTLLDKFLKKPDIQERVAHF